MTLVLDEHPMVADVCESTQPVYRKLLSNPNLPLTTREQYVDTVFSALSHILSCVGQLNDGLFYLSHYPTAVDYFNSGISFEEYVAYHIEGYYIRQHSLLDRSYALVNSVMQIGLPERRLDSIPTIPVIKRHPVGTVLLGFRRVLKRSRPTRNVVTHREAYSDQLLRRLTFIHRFAPATVGLPQLRQEYITSRISEYREMVDVSTRMVSLLMDSPLPEWRARANRSS